MTDHTNTYPDLVNVEDWLNAKGYTGEAGACHQAMDEINKLRAATTPICVGRRIIGILAKEGAWTSENGASVIAADELFQRDPYEEIEKLRAALKPFADAADDIEHGDKDSYNLWEHPAAMSITIGDLRNCQRILDGSTIE